MAECNHVLWDSCCCGCAVKVPICGQCKVLSSPNHLLECSVSVMRGGSEVDVADSSAAASELFSACVAVHVDCCFCQVGVIVTVVLHAMHARVYPSACIAGSLWVLSTAWQSVTYLL